jgi:hypothetical protein
VGSRPHLRCSPVGGKSIQLCWEKGALYLDTCVEPWPGGYTDPNVPAAKRTNYALREDALALRAGHADAPTAVVTRTRMRTHLRTHRAISHEHSAASVRKESG